MATAKTQSKTSRKDNSGCMSVIALPFAGFGLLMLGWTARDAWTWSTMRNWVETPATLIEAGLEVHDDSDDDGETYQATARYHYVFEGRRYVGGRVSLYEGADNIGDYQQRRGAELERLKRLGEPIACYVNPDRPSDAVLFRDLRPGFLAFKGLFALPFLVIGTGLLVAGRHGWQNSQRQAAAAHQSPNEPWRWREDWAAGRLRSNSSRTAWLATFVAAFWNFGSWIALISVIMGEDPGWATLFVLSFTAIGAGLAAWAGYLWLRHWRWGASEFEMAAVPGVLGGPVAGVIHAPGGIQPIEGFMLRLACVERMTETRGGKTRSRDETVWEQQQKVLREATTDGRAKTLIPVQFIIPYALPPTGAPFTWKLTVRGRTPGVDYHAEFEVPVFKTAASSPAPPMEAAINAKLYAPPPELAAIVAALGGRVEEDSAERRTIYLPAARNRGMAAMMTLFIVVWIGVCVGIFWSDAPWFFGWLFSAVGAALAGATLWMMLERTRLSFGPAGVEVTRWTFGALRKQFTTEEIAGIGVERSGFSYGNTTLRNVTLRTTGGDSHVLASQISRHGDAERLASEIRAAIGLLKSRTHAETMRMPLEAELPSELRAE